MTTAQWVSDTSRPRSAELRRVLRLALVGLAVGAVIVVAAFGTSLVVNRSDSPGDLSPEAGFARDMQVHHAQAVEMALIFRDKTTDPTLRAISYDIITTQQQQAGQMYAWLQAWELSPTGTRPPMAWIGATHGSGHPMSMGTQGDSSAMPGMASSADIAQLSKATGAAARRQFLTLMIAHHRGGVQMAQAALDQARQPQVRQLAAAIQTSQTAEIQQMQTLLQASR